MGKDSTSVVTLPTREANESQEAYKTRLQAHLKRLAELPPEPASEPPDVDYWATHAPRLRTNGYTLVGILPGEKRPVEKGWQERDLTGETYPPGYGIGIATRDTPALDLDLKNPALIERSLKVVRKFVGEDATLRIRVGEPPKALVPFRLEGEPFGKMQFYLDPAQCKRGDPKVELLANGQQFVANHIHPSTGKPYTWNVELADTPHERLPPFTRERAIELMACLRTELGVPTSAPTPAHIASPPSAPGAALTGRRASPALVKACLDRISSDVDRHEWVRRLSAVAYERGAEGEALAREWSKRGQDYQEAAFDKAWRSFFNRTYPGTPARIGTLIMLARETDPNFDPRQFDSEFKPNPLAPLHHWQPKTTEELVREKPIEWCIEGLLKRGVLCVLVAAGSTGKTWLMIHLFCSGATGRDFFGHRVMRSGTAVLLSLDDSQEDLNGALADYIRENNFTAAEIEAIRTQVRLIALDDAARSTFTRLERGEAVETEFARQLDDAIAGIPDCVMLGLDVLRQFSGASSNDEHAMTLVLTALKTIGTARDVNVFLSHHSTKEGARSGVEDLQTPSGSGAIGAIAKAVWILLVASWREAYDELELDPLMPFGLGDVYRLVSARGALRMKTPPPIWFYRLGYRFAHIKGTPKTADEKNLDAFRQVVVVIDKLGKKATMETIYEHIGGRKETCRANIKGWAARGWLQRDSDRKPYTVTEEGRKEAQIDTV